MNHHDLKADPSVFEQVLRGYKTFEFRKDDRDFNESDTATLHEFDRSTQTYSGRTFSFVIGFILRDSYGLPPGYCILSILPESYQ